MFLCIENNTNNDKITEKIHCRTNILLCSEYKLKD